MKKLKKILLLMVLPWMLSYCAMLPDSVVEPFSEKMAEVVNEQYQKNARTDENAADIEKNIAEADENVADTEKNNIEEYNIDEHNTEEYNTDEHNADIDGTKARNTDEDCPDEDTEMQEDKSEDFSLGDRWKNSLKQSQGPNLVEKIQIFFQRLLAAFTGKKGSSVLAEGEEKTVGALLHKGGPSQEKEYTVMIYMVGSNLESGNGCASRDIEEMVGSGVDSSRINILIYTGGSIYWKNGIPGDRNTVYRIDQGQRVEVASTEQSENMGEADTLCHFLQFCGENYPARHYALICWDHGNGPIHGFGQDEKFSQDALTLGELKDALERSPFNGENALDWMGYDACLMSTLEAAQTVEAYVGYFLASQETIPGTGWDYRFLHRLNETSAAEEIAKEVLKTYEESAQQFDEWQHPDLTLACIELSKLPDLEEALKQLGERMNAGLQEGKYMELAQKRDATKRLGLGAVKDRNQSLDLVDLADMAVQLEEDYPEEAAALIRTVEAAVIDQTSNVADTCGLSLYYPYDNKVFYLDEGRIQYSEVMGVWEYRNYLESFAGFWNRGPGSPASVFMPTAMNGETVDISLSQAEVQSLSSAYYHILWKRGEYLYQPVLTDCKVLPDEEGVLHIPSNPILFTSTSKDILTPLLITVKQAEQVKGRSLYLSQGTLAKDGRAEFKPVSVNFYLEDGNPEDGRQPILQSIRENLEFSLHNGKNDVNLKEWNEFESEVKKYRMPEPKENEAAQHVPYTQWESTEEKAYRLILFDDVLPLETTSAWEQKEDFICQVVLESVYGGQKVAAQFYVDDGTGTKFDMAGDKILPKPMETQVYQNGIMAYYIPWYDLNAKGDGEAYCAECMWQYEGYVSTCWFCGKPTITVEEYYEHWYNNAAYQKKLREAMKEVQARGE